MNDPEDSDRASASDLVLDGSKQPGFIKTSNILCMYFNRYIKCLCITVFLFGAQMAWSADRYALVIGNSDYSEVGALANPVNDARAIAERLDAFGFKRLDVHGNVTDKVLENLDRRSFLRAINNFVRTVRSAADVEMVFVYYAGHGMQRSGRPYILPVDVPADDVDLAFEESIDLNSLLSRFDGLGDVTVAVFDACREIPQLENMAKRAGYSGTSREFRGLARVASTGRSRLVAYAGAAGELVSDGNGRHSPYTQTLLNALDNPSRSIEDLFQDTAYQFSRESGGQSPEVLVQGVQPNRFYLALEDLELETSQADGSELQAQSNGVADDEQSAVVAVEPVAELSIGVLDNALWEAARQDNTESSYQRYLERFENGVFSGIAKDRLQRLRQAREQREAQLAAEQSRVLEGQRQQAQAQEDTDRQAALAEQQRLETIERERNQAARLAEAKAAEKTLALSRNWRRGVQVALNAAGISVGTPDGLWGARTREGIRQWQAENALPETGYLTGSDYRQLVAELSVVEVAPPKPVRQAFEPEMVRIEGGRFEMGTRKGGAYDELPVRTVSVRAFEMGKYEVTFNQYDAYARSAGVALPSDNGWGRGSRPVINVSWKDAQSYINWLNAKTAGGYRLPSEAEWEYAARAGTRGSWSFTGDESALCNYGNGRGNSCQDGFENTAPVGSFKSNKNGLFDVHGNVLEWTQDCWHENYRGAPTNGSAWINNGDCGRRVLRGGSSGSKPDDLRSANRGRINVSYRYSNTGFRLSRTLTP